MARVKRDFELSQENRNCISAAIDLLSDTESEFMHTIEILRSQQIGDIPKSILLDAFDEIDENVYLRLKDNLEKLVENSLIADDIFEDVDSEVKVRMGING